MASVTLRKTRETRVRGKLASVDVAGSSYTVDLRPFHERNSSTGQVVVHTSTPPRSRSTARCPPARRA